MKSAIGALALLALVSGCRSLPHPTTGASTVAAGPVIAAAARLARAATPPLASESRQSALAAFRRSCPALVKRTDVSGLTRPGDWADACAFAENRPGAAEPSAVFDTLVAVRVEDGTGLNTGYFEPELAGSMTAASGYPVPLYKRPPDLIEVDLGAFADGLKGRKVRGRVQGNALVPYYDRAEIDSGALAGRGLELAWAADPYDAFFLEIQGSGRLRLPDGAVVRIGYDGQNGHDYTAIGRLLRQRGAMAEGAATMDGIIAWMKAQPDGGAALMRENRSKVFFRRLSDGDAALGPPGALGVALTPEVSVAADPKFVPLGGPLLLGGRLMIAQDTGGAIRGPNRLDSFEGAGPGARARAGSLAAQSQVLLLLPRVSVERLGIR